MSKDDLEIRWLRVKCYDLKEHCQIFIGRWAKDKPVKILREIPQLCMEQWWIQVEGAFDITSLPKEVTLMNDEEILYFGLDR